MASCPFYPSFALTDALVADIRPGHVMGAQFAVATSLPTLGLGREALVALNVIGTLVAQPLRDRMTLLGIVLGHSHKSSPTDADPVGY